MVDFSEDDPSGLSSFGFLTHHPIMRILHFISSLRHGGAERLVTDLVRQLSDSGHDVSVLLLDGTRTHFLEELEKSGIRVSALSSGIHSMRNPVLVFKLIRFLKKGKFDIIHTHNTSCQFFAAMASVFLRVRMVTTEHNTSNRRRSWWWFKPVDRWMYSRYSRIICVGKETSEGLKNYLGDAVSGKIVVIGNGIDLKRFREAVPDRELSSLPGCKIIMVAAFRAQKDQDTLIKALATLPDEYSLFLVGGVELPEDEPNLIRCQALVEDLGLRSRVRFLGKRNDVPSLLAAADVVVLSTHYEGMSLSVIEGMASGKPFVASDVNGVREQVEGAGVLFPEGDQEALATIIKRLYLSSDYAMEVSERCVNRAMTHDLGLTARSHLEEYSAI